MGRLQFRFRFRSLGEGSVTKKARVLAAAAATVVSPQARAVETMTPNDPKALVGATEAVSPYPIQPARLALDPIRRPRAAEDMAAAQFAPQNRGVRA